MDIVEEIINYIDKTKSQLDKYLVSMKIKEASLPRLSTSKLPEKWRVKKTMKKLRKNILKFIEVQHHIEQGEFQAASKAIIELADSDTVFPHIIDRASESSSRSQRLREYAIRLVSQTSGLSIDH